MPTREAVQEAMDQIEAEGLHPSVERVTRRIGGSHRDICTPVTGAQDAACASACLSLADLVVAAKRCVLSHVEPLPGAVLDVLNVDRKPRATMSDLWHAVVPACTNAQDEAARVAGSWRR